MSGIGGKLALEARNKAVGMLLAGASQQAVAQMFSVTVQTVQRWWRRSKTCDSLQDKKRSGRPKKLSRVSKIVLAKSLTKKRQSTRKLAARLSAKGHACSKDVRRYLVGELGAKAQGGQPFPRLECAGVPISMRFTVFQCGYFTSPKATK